MVKCHIGEIFATWLYIEQHPDKGGCYWIVTLNYGNLGNGKIQVKSEQSTIKLPIWITSQAQNNMDNNICVQY